MGDRSGIDLKLGPPDLRKASYPVHVDIRWPAHSNIGKAMHAFLERAPSHLRIEPLPIDCEISSPWSPFAVTRALRCHQVLQRPDPGGVFWNPGFVPALCKGIPSVVTVNDLTSWHDCARWQRTYFDLLFRSLYRRMNAIVCSSDATRREFLAWSGVPRERVHVVWHNVGKEFLQDGPAYKVPYPYVLYAGNRRRHRNLKRLFAAYARSALPAMGIHLMLTGQSDKYLNELAYTHGVSRRVSFTGHLPDVALPAIFRGALFLAFVSLQEGFAVRVLEAMASRTPVLTSNLSSMPEIAGNAALLVNPYSVDEIAKAMTRLARDTVLRSELVEQGVERLRAFSWDRSACALWDIVDQTHYAARQATV